MYGKESLVSSSSLLAAREEAGDAFQAQAVGSNSPNGKLGQADFKSFPVPGTGLEPARYRQNVSALG